MAVIAPNSEIYLIKCPIELDNLNQLSFANATAQHNYFNGLPKLSLTNATFQRKDGTIRWPGSMESILEYNYCMYRNKNHGNKWFYAFIDGMRYESESMTSVKISTDVWQTWQFDLTFKASYIEREHTNDDTIGANTIPEGLDTGEYICNDIVEQKYGECDWTKPGMMVVLQVTTLHLEKDGVVNKVTNPPTRNTVNGIPGGCYYVGVEFLQSELGLVPSLISTYTSFGKSNAIVSMFLCPKNVTQWTKTRGSGIWSGNNYYVTVDSVSPFQFGQAQVPINSTLDGYTPKNNKMYVFPYNYIYASNNSGTDIEYRYEDFRGTPIFTTRGTLEQGGAIKCSPDNSKVSRHWNGTVMAGDSWNEGLNGSKFPQLNWLSDYYLNWEAQNGKNIAIQTGLSALGFATNTLTGGLTGGFGNYNSINSAMTRLNWMPTGDDATKRDLLAMGNANDQIQYIGGGGTGPAGSMFGGLFNFASQVANTQNAIRNAKMVPPQAQGNVSGGYLQFSADMYKFSFRKMSVRAEYARAIDSYFSMFGYKTNRMKMPNITGRTNWNYVKTVGCNVLADIPQEDLQAVKAMFNNGVTIWHNPATYLDYSQNNAIV